MKPRKNKLEERVDELEAEVRWLSWLVDKHIYDEGRPHWHFTDTVPKPDPLTGWKVT